MKNWKEIVEGISAGFSVITNSRKCEALAKKTKGPTEPPESLVISVRRYPVLLWLGTIIVLMMAVRSMSITIQAGDITINNIHGTRAVEPSAIDNQ